MKRVWLAGLLCAGLSLAARADEPAADASDVEPGVDTSAGTRAPQPESDRFDTMDRLRLDTTSITGNQELPKVLYIVPWKQPVAGDLPAPPLSGLLEEVLSPVDREVFRRHISYFRNLDDTAAVAPDSTGPSAERRLAE